MTFQKAEQMLAQMADGRYHTLAFERTTYHNGDRRETIQAYIEGVGITGGHASYESALSELSRKIGGMTETNQAPEMEVA